jgi:hypothetical protein
MGRGDPRRYRRHKGTDDFRFWISDLGFGIKNQQSQFKNLNNVTYLKKDIRIGFWFFGSRFRIAPEP